MLKSDHDKALAAKDKQLATQADLLRSVREENRKLALSVSSQSLRIAELERSLASTSEQASDSQRQQIIDKMVKPLMRLIERWRPVHVYCEDPWYSCPKAPGGCANENAGSECNCGADAANDDINKTLAAVKSKLASIEKETK